MSLNENNLSRRFESVSTSQGSIQSLSFFCLHYKNHHKKIAHIWLRCLQKAKVPHRLTLIYLANDIVQNAKRKNTLSFIDDFKSILRDTVPYLRDEKIKKSVERVFSIWQDRAIFDSKFTTELKNSLNGIGRVAQVEAPKSSQKKESGDTLTVCLSNLANIEKNLENLKSPEELNNLKNCISSINNQIDVAMNNQKTLLKESEEQLANYNTRLDYITKLRDDLLKNNSNNIIEFN